MICFIRITGAVAIVNGVGMEAIEGLRFLASLPLAGTGWTEGGEKTQPFNRFHSRLFIFPIPDSKCRACRACSAYLFVTTIAL